MGRPLKIKKSTTSDIGFPPFSALTAPVVPEGFTPNSATEYAGVVGGNKTGVASATFPVLRVQVFGASESAEEAGTIVRQKGSIQYLVLGVSTGNTFQCTLANEATGALTAGNMNIAIFSGDSTDILVKRMSNKFAIDYSDTRYALNFFTDEGTEIKSGTTATTLALAIVENYTS